MNNVIIYDANLKAVADLPQAFDISYELRANEVGKASFSVPIDDVHLSEITQRRYAEIYDNDRRIGLFRIVRLTKAENTLKAECEHVLATLADTELNDTLYGSAGTATAINEVLAEQSVSHWQLGTCDFDEQFLYEWPRGTTLLKALLSIPEKFQFGYFWTFDTTSHPWTLNLIEPPTVVTAYIDYGRNMMSIEREEDVTNLVTKLYPHGAKAGEAQIGISSVEPSGNDYIENYSYTTEVITRHWTDQNYVTEQELYDAAVALLEKLSQPKYTYRVTAADLYRITGESIDKFEIGALVKVSNPEMDIDADVRVMSITKNDLTGKPGDIVLELANKGEEFDFTDKVNVNDLSGIDINDVPGGTPGALPGPLAGTGLTITTDYLGYHVESEWKTYMDIVGRLWADAGDDAYFHFDPTVPSLEIKMTGGDTYDDIVQALADAAAAQAAADAAQATADGKIQSFWQDSAPTYGMGEGDFWFDTDDGNHIYRYTSGAWVDAQDNKIGQALQAAATAQATADGKITTFYQDTVPTSEGLGDLWVNTGDDNKLYRAASAGADEIKAGEWVLIRDAGITQALSDAATALEIADGEIVGFYQDEAPTSGMKFGDIWIDTDGADPLDTSCIYRYQDENGRSQGPLDWYAAPNNAVGKVYLNAASAQATADGKVTTFYQDDPPTSGMAEGDWWVDINDNNKLYVYSGSEWIMTTNSDALQALSAAAQAQATADGQLVGFYQDEPPTSGMYYGDIWIDTDGADPLDETCIYRYQDENGGYTEGAMSWYPAPDNAVGKAYLNAANAQAAADGKITTYYQDDPPSEADEGDLWVDTDDNYKVYRWSGSQWDLVTGAVAHLNIITDAYIQSLSFDKITAATNTASLTIGGAGYLQSANYDEGNAGFRINGNGNAEFNDVTVRGALIAGSGSRVNGSYIDNLSVGTAKIENLAVSNIKLAGEITYDKIQSISLDSVVTGTLTSDFIVINNDLNFHPGSTWHSIMGCAYMEGYHSGTDIHSLRLGSASSDSVLLKCGPNTSLSLSPSSSGTSQLHGYNNVEIWAENGELTLKWGSSYITFGKTSLTGGQWGLGYINVSIGGVMRSFAIENPH